MTFTEMDLIQVISNVGFPIVVSIYLLHRFEKRLGKLEAAIKRLTEVLTIERK